MTSGGLAAEVAEVPWVEAVLAAHRLTTPVQCACGWRETDPSAGTWAAHVAAEVTKALTTALGRPEVVEALTDALRPLWGAPASNREWSKTQVAAALAAIPEALGAGEVGRG